VNLLHYKQKFLEVLDFYNVNGDAQVTSISKASAIIILCLRFWRPDGITGKGVGEKIDYRNV